MPARTLPADQVAEARGFADGFALRLKHHDSSLHARGAPAEAVERSVLDAVDSARVEALGARGYAGIAASLAAALGLMVRERLTGQEAPARAAPGLSLVRDWSEEKAGGDLDALGLAIDDQRVFAGLVNRLLECLELFEGDMLPDEADQGGSEDEGTEDRQDDSEEGDEPGEQGQGEMDARGEPRDADGEEGESAEQ